MIRFVDNINNVKAYGEFEDTPDNRALIASWGYTIVPDEYVRGYDGNFYTKGTEPVKPAGIAAAEEIYELKNKLAASDYAITKIAEGSATVEEYADLIAQRKAWRARINDLEGIINNV